MVVLVFFPESRADRGTGVQGSYYKEAVVRDRKMRGEEERPI